MALEWYFLRVQVGREDTIRQAMIRRLKQAGIEDRVPQLVVPTETIQDHRGGNWKVQAQKARRRDGYACRVCGVSEEELGRRLDVHHKIPYASFRSNLEANKLENLMSWTIIN